ncbi:MAG: DUF4145 domain-containing protein [Ramlibacter sp.]|nr:DUF4145 domain-containing protein [Ramlibacter sp.]
MNKDLWKQSFEDGACPEWPCPACHAGVLVLEKGSLRHAATDASMRDRDEEWWGPEHVVYSFTAWAACSNQSCGEKFALTGTGGLEEYYGDDGDSEYADVFHLRHCHPTLHMIAVSDNCPEALRDALNAAFSLFWIDRPSAAGRIRVAVERLLDHLAIPTKNAKGGYLPLDDRIDAFGKSDSVHGAQLMALKWLGNVGAHTIDVNADDLLAAFEVLEHVLSEVIDRKSAAIAKLAAEMTKKYGKP